LFHKTDCGKPWTQLALRLCLVVVGFVLIKPSALQAQPPETVSQARLLASQTHRLVLLEFYRDD